MKRKILAFAVVILMVTGLSSLASAGINQTSVSSQQGYVLAYLGWNIEETDTWNYSDTFWDLNVQITQAGSNWLVDWDFTHKVGPHGEGANVTSYHGTSFADSLNGNVVSMASSWTHGSNNHIDDWDLRLYRDAGDSANNTIRFKVGHGAPEPISSILFVVGGTLLTGRRYFKRKNK